MTDMARDRQWPLQDAKARFSELINRCVSEGAQTITKHGEPTAVVLPWQRYGALIGRSRNLVDFLASAPRAELDIERSLEPERGVEL